jgi:hypothetical protein
MIRRIPGRDIVIWLAGYPVSLFKEHLTGELADGQTGKLANENVYFL